MSALKLEVVASIPSLNLVNLCSEWDKVDDYLMLYIDEAKILQQ